MQLLSWKTASSASQLPSGSQAVACLQLLRPALVLPPSLPVRSIWGRGEDIKQVSTRHINLNQFFQLFSQGIHFVLADTQRGPGVQCGSRRPESLCCFAFPCRKRGCGISRELGLRGSSQLPPPLRSPPSPVPQIQATDVDISKYSRAQCRVGKAGKA